MLVLLAGSLTWGPTNLCGGTRNSATTAARTDFWAAKTHTSAAEIVKLGPGDWRCLTMIREGSVCSNVVGVEFCSVEDVNVAIRTQCKPDPASTVSCAAPNMGLSELDSLSLVWPAQLLFHAKPVVGLESLQQRGYVPMGNICCWQPSYNN